MSNEKIEMVATSPLDNDRYIILSFTFWFLALSTACICTILVVASWFDLANLRKHMLRTLNYRIAVADPGLYIRSPDTKPPIVEAT